MDVNALCPNCMREVPDRENKHYCPHCGYDLSTVVKEGHALKPFTILEGKYLTGNVIGEGGFGITYVGFDINLELRLAIKEFYPYGYVTRESDHTTQVTVFTSGSQYYDKWKESFVREARNLGKFTNLPGIVGVRDFFIENNTAYIVMEYIDGITLKEYLKNNDGKLSVEISMNLMKPVIKSLSKVHKGGLVHRDISPDNIMINREGDLKLIDFGAARDYDEGERSLSVLLKPGYAPEEQYRTHGEQGPWTDVYAVSATLYKCITGNRPVESMERMRKDTLVKPSDLGVDIPREIEEALLKGMAVYMEDRFKSMDEFYDAMYNSKPAAVVKPQPENKDGSDDGKEETPEANEKNSDRGGNWHVVAVGPGKFEIQEDENVEKPQITPEESEESVQKESRRSSGSGKKGTKSSAESLKEESGRSQPLQQLTPDKKKTASRSGETTSKNDKKLFRILLTLVVIAAIVLIVLFVAVVMTLGEKNNRETELDLVVEDVKPVEKPSVQTKEVSEPAFPSPAAEPETKPEQVQAAEPEQEPENEHSRDYETMQEALDNYRFEVNEDSEEKYENIVKINDYSYFSSGVSDFSFYYPNNLYNKVEYDVFSEYSNPDEVYGRPLSHIHFSGSEGGELDFYCYIRNDKLTTEQEWRSCSTKSKSRYEKYNPVMDDMKAENNTGVTILGGALKSIGYYEYVYYDLTRVYEDYVMCMIIKTPKVLETANEDINTNDRFSKGYYVDCIYRGCCFSRSSNSMRSYEEFVNGKN